MRFHVKIHDFQGQVYSSKKDFFLIFFYFLFFFKTFFLMNDSQFSDLSKVIIIFVESFYSFHFFDNLVDFN